MKTPEEFKAAVYQKRDAAQKRRKRTALGLCLAAVVVLGGGFFALRGLGLSGVTGYEEGGPTLQVLAPPALQDLHDMDALYSTTEDGAFTIDQEAQEEFNRLGEESKVEEAFPQAVSGFAQKAAPLLLGEEENGCFSPLSLYYALALAGSGSQGKTQEEFLEVLCAPDLDWLGDQAGRCYRQLYQDNDRGTLTMANSLWLQKGYPFAQSFLDTAGEDYFAALFSGDFRDPQLGSEVSRWISDNTQGLLAPELQFDTSARLAVVNTLYFHSKWMDEFDPHLTSPEEFTRADGSTVTADFMHAEGQWTSAWMGENYTIAVMGLSSRGFAFFVLPEEGTTPQELLEDPDFWEGLEKVMDGGAYAQVNWSVPKFTVDSQFDLGDVLPQLGLTTAGNPATADFSGMTEVERLTLSGGSHGVHFAIDEEGIEAAAYTATSMSGSSGPPPLEIDMVLDRPFLYGVTALTSTEEMENGRSDSTLLFLGVCGDPTAS